VDQWAVQVEEYVDPGRSCETRCTLNLQERQIRDDGWLIYVNSPTLYTYQSAAAEGGGESIHPRRVS